MVYGNCDAQKNKKASKTTRLPVRSCMLRLHKVPTVLGNTVVRENPSVLKKAKHGRRKSIFNISTNESAADNSTISSVSTTGPSASRRTLTNFEYCKSKSQVLLGPKEVKVGDGKCESLVKKDPQQKMDIDQAASTNSNHSNRSNVSQQEKMKECELSEQTILPNFQKCQRKRTEVFHIQTSCLLQTIAKSCQTLRESQLDILNSKLKFQTLLDKIRDNKWGYEFTYVIFQTATEISNKSIMINNSKKPCMVLSKVMNQIEHFDDLIQFDDACFSQHETKELIDVVTWLLNNSKFQISGTVDPTEVRVILQRLDKNKMDFPPVGIFEVTLTPESHALQRWSALHNGANRVIQCYMFLPPTKAYKCLRHGFSNKSSKREVVVFQNHLPFLEEETESFLLWDIWKTQEEHELIMVLVVHLVDDEQFYEEAHFHDHLVYKVKDPASLLIKHVLLYSRQQYQTFMKDERKLLQQKKSRFNVFSMNFKLVLAVVFMAALGLVVAFFLFKSGKKESKPKPSVLIELIRFCLEMV